MRKLKEDYTMSFSYRTFEGDCCVLHMISPEAIQQCIDNNMKRDMEGCEIIDYQFFAPDGKRCTIEDATENIIKKESGTYWRFRNGRVYKLILNMELDCPNFNDTNNKLTFVSSGGFFFTTTPFEDCTPVKNWEGDLL